MSLLPSRAADNLLWLGRYVERAETMVRLLRAYHLRLAETGRLDDPRVARLDAHLRGEMRALIRRLQRETGITTLLLEQPLRFTGEVFHDRGAMAILYLFFNHHVPALHLLKDAKPPPPKRRRLCRPRGRLRGSGHIRNWTGRTWR